MKYSFLPVVCWKRARFHRQLLICVYWKEIVMPTAASEIQTGHNLWAIGSHLESYRIYYEAHLSDVPGGSWISHIAFHESRKQARQSGIGDVHAGKNISQPAPRPSQELRSTTPASSRLTEVAPSNKGYIAEGCDSLNCWRTRATHARRTVFYVQMTDLGGSYPFWNR